MLYLKISRSQQLEAKVSLNDNAEQKSDGAAVVANDGVQTTTAGGGNEREKYIQNQLSVASLAKFIQEK